MNAKQLFIFAFTSLTISLVSAQVSFNNGNFESWDSSTKLPYGWNSISLDLPVIGNISFCSVKKSTKAYEGSYSVQLKPERLSPIITGLAEQYLEVDDLDKLIIPSLITNGKLNVTLDNITELANLIAQSNDDMSDIMNSNTLGTLLKFLSDGVDIKAAGSEKINHVGGYYNFQPQSENEYVLFAVMLTNEEGNQPAIAGGGIFTATQETDGFVPFSIEVTQLNNADKLYFLALVICSDMEQESTGPLYLDKININGNVALNKITQDDNSCLVYPNPTTDKTFKVNVDKPQKVIISNQAGQTIQEIPSYTPQSDISVEKSGIYFIQTDNKTEKIIVK